jgi:hypothetical protein
MDNRLSRDLLPNQETQSVNLNELKGPIKNAHRLHHITIMEIPKINMHNLSIIKKVPENKKRRKHYRKIRFRYIDFFLLSILFYYFFSVDIRNMYYNYFIKIVIRMAFGFSYYDRQDKFRPTHRPSSFLFFFNFSFVIEIFINIGWELG